MSMKLRLLLSLLMLSSLIASGPVPTTSAESVASAEGVQVITVTAKKYEFGPSSIHVKQGTKVRLNITAEDHAHGFKISSYPEGGDKSGEPGLVFSSPQDCIKIEKGQTASVEFTAQRAGTYPFRCCVVCGWHHRAMKGELLVER
jgi:cytochrome c oxidase subunit II